MIVYIFRHGHAENKGDSPDKTDEGRRLVKEGEEQVRWTCAQAKKFGVVPTVIMSSPRVRGKQTAEMTKQLMNPKATMLTDGCLEPEGKAAPVYKVLSKFKKEDQVILVTHLPNLGHLFVDMLSWEASWKNLDFENGAMARIDFKGLPKPKAGNLVWLISPNRSG
jgi:phosphohistidine phosphatase